MAGSNVQVVALSLRERFEEHISQCVSLLIKTNYETFSLATLLEILIMTVW